MLYLIWSLINVVLFLSFLYLIIGFIIRGKKVLATQFKLFSILIMIMGVAQILSGFNIDKDKNKKLISTDFNKIGKTKIIKVKLEENLTFNINLDIKYSIENNERLNPLESNSYLTGFLSGYEWKFHLINTNSFKINEKSKFTATGVLNWNLFGINIYSESKVFKGIVK